ncbi:MAG TPA: hypothetical protein VFV50_14025, partial [Bdellovibrionales bacterium]|nr:hypothetical protein [Bdellovibrionales bacterium]
IYDIDKIFEIFNDYGKPRIRPSAATLEQIASDVLKTRSETAIVSFTKRVLAARDTEPYAGAMAKILETIRFMGSHFSAESRQEVVAVAQKSFSFDPRVTRAIAEVALPLPSRTAGANLNRMRYFGYGGAGRCAAAAAK